jgi:CrcB protein
LKALTDVLWVGLGGFVGSSLRFLVSGWVHRLIGGGTFPYGTFAVNVIGCLAIGLFGGLAEHRQLFSATTRLFLLIGLLGGFTTFSTVAFETLTLAHGSDAAKAIANITLQVVFGLIAAWLGFLAARSL